MQRQHKCNQRGYHRTMGITRRLWRPRQNVDSHSDNRKDATDAETLRIIDLLTVQP